MVFFWEVVVGKIDFFYIIFADFCRFLAILTILVHFHFALWGVLGHFSDIFRIFSNFLGDPRDLFRRFGGNFGHF